MTKTGEGIISGLEGAVEMARQLRDADARGVGPPQDWTTRAATALTSQQAEIERLRGALREARQWCNYTKAANLIDAALQGEQDDG